MPVALGMESDEAWDGLEFLGAFTVWDQPLESSVS